MREHAESIQNPGFTSKPSGHQSGVGFTEGPWAVAPFDSDLYAMVSANMTREMGDKTLNGGVYVAKAQGPDSQANARLIASAPALYAAMEAALPMLRMLAKFGEDNVWRPAKRNLDAFEAALAKARGDAA